MMRLAVLNSFHWMALSAVCLAAAGCGGSDAEETSRVTVVPVKGQITVAGKPPVGARVMLHPTGANTAAKGLAPSGIVGADGTFLITTYEGDDGAPPGEYGVSVYWPDLEYKPKTTVEAEEIRMGGQAPDKLKKRYADPERSGLKATVGEDPMQSLPPIELK